MNKFAIKTIGKRQTSRDDSLLFILDEIEGLMETLDKDFSEWSDLIAGKTWVHNNGFFQELWMFIVVRK